MIRPLLGMVAGAYFALLFLYSFVLKHLVIIDALTIAGGFVLRAAAGAVAIAVPISHWLLVCTTLLALFLSFSKRRHELTLLAEGAIDHRPDPPRIQPLPAGPDDRGRDRVNARGLRRLRHQRRNGTTAGHHRLGLTIPFVLYGIFRYLYLVHQKGAAAARRPCWSRTGHY